MKCSRDCGDPLYHTRLCTRKWNGIEAGPPTKALALIPHVTTTIHPRVWPEWLTDWLTGWLVGWYSVCKGNKSTWTFCPTSSRPLRSRWWFVWWCDLLGPSSSPPILLGVVVVCGSMRLWLFLVVVGVVGEGRTHGCVCEKEMRWDEMTHRCTSHFTHPERTRAVELESI